MSELQQKKIARDASIAKAEQEAAAKAAAEEAALTKAFTDRAEKYEKEYEQVSSCLRGRAVDKHQHCYDVATEMKMKEYLYGCCDEEFES